MKHKKNPMIRKTFGALRIVAFAGRQTSNKCWAFYCLVCGELGFRQGTAIRNGHKVGCPECHAMRAKRPHAKRPAREKIDAFLAAIGAEGRVDPEPKARNRLHLLSDVQFLDLRANVEAETERRGLLRCMTCGVTKTDHDTPGGPTLCDEFQARIEL